MSNSSGPNATSKYKENKQQLTKESNTLDNKHRMMVRQFNKTRSEKDTILDNINNINIELETLKSTSINTLWNSELLNTTF